jgi:putative ABC transport system permease protein
VEYVYIFSSIGMFILLIALINYTNLETTMILERIKESGLRKILGAKSSQIINYFLLESVFYHLVGMILAGALVLLIFPYFKSLTNIEFTLNPIRLASGMVGLTLICGLLTGLYPAWILNRSDSIQNLKGAPILNKKGRTVSLKRVLVTLQYTISVLLIGSAFIARDQFKFLIESNLGMTRDQIIAIPGVPDKVKDGYQRFKDRISASPDILKVTACMEVPSREIRDSGPVLVKGGNNNPEEAPVMDIQVIDDDYLDVLGIKLTGGKNIPESLKSAPIPEFTQSYTYVDYLQEQRRVYLINETAMKLLGWQSPEDALGQEISWSISNITLDFGPISGVVKDYHQETLKNTIDPTIMVYEPIWLRTFMIKLKTERIQETIAGIKGVWDELFPQYPMEYYFLDDLYEDLNKNERVKLELLYLLSGQAIIISFIGLFGLISFSLKTRIREIAIRKVLGADAGRLIKLIGQEYLLILVLASIVAVPLSYFFIDRWLQQFAYKADISFANYGITVILMGLLILFTVSFQTIKTSSINPADTLREE